MYKVGSRITAVLSVPVAVLLLGGVAGAKGKGASDAGVPEARGAAPVAETSSRAQHDAALEAEVGDLTGVSPEVKEAREAAGAAGMRARELKEQTRGLSEEAVAQQNVVENFDVQKDGPDIDVVVDGPSGRTQDQHRRQVKQHKKSERALKETVGELEEKKEEYEESREEEKSRGEELRSREDEVKRAVDKLGTGKQKRVEERIEQLEVAEEAGEIETPPASGDGGAGGAFLWEQEVRIAEEEIVARSVEEIPYKRYVQIYKTAAKRYGFTEDWYVLAAVGKVESDHGQNLGPSSAGAMGPMQFLPSTWQEFGVDGNGDGEANIMDPEDAIPAAASYLKYGGAPKDFSAALFTYNRSGSYVREVLGIAEGYRRLAKDDEVEPYV